MSKFKVAQAEDRYGGLAEALLSNPLGQVVFLYVAYCFVTARRIAKRCLSCQNVCQSGIVCQNVETCQGKIVSPNFWFSKILMGLPQTEGVR